MSTETLQQTWTAVDELIERTLPQDPPATRLAAERAAAAGLPAISVTPPTGRLLAILTRLARARRVLEIGTLGGYSTCWFHHALEPGGSVTTLEIDPQHARIARETFELAGIAHAIDLRLGRALDVLPTLLPAHARAFDVAFIDADKPSNPAYVEFALRLVRPAGLIIVDNVVRHGAILDPVLSDASAKGALQAIADLGRIGGDLATVLATAGVKGYDGLAVAIVP
jgi:predicted O-methyltransferase YrrM